MNRSKVSEFQCSLEKLERNIKGGDMNTDVDRVTLFICVFTNIEARYRFVMRKK